jgi:hypothetical protein
METPLRTPSERTPKGQHLDTAAAPKGAQLIASAAILGLLQATRPLVPKVGDSQAAADAVVALQQALAQFDALVDTYSKHLDTTAALPGAGTTIAAALAAGIASSLAPDLQASASLEEAQVLAAERTARAQ